jgi:hypothetical protein
MFSGMPACQQILLNPGEDSFPFTTGYRCKGFAEGFYPPDQNLCVCYEATANPTVFKQFLTGAMCSIMATCACDGFLDNFNSLLGDFSCVGSGFAHHDHLFLLWIPKISTKGIQSNGNTSNLVCFPDDYCQSLCETPCAW